MGKEKLGTTADEIIRGFRDASNAKAGISIVEAEIIGGNLRFRWQAGNKLGVVVGHIGLRDATDAEYAELEESVELGQVHIYTMQLYYSGRGAMRREVLHRATGFPLDENSPAAIRQRQRWARAEASRA